MTSPVTSADDERKLETTCACSCGWTLTTRAATRELARAAADRARANHLRHEHPEQATHPRVTSSDAGPHRRTIGPALKEDHRWYRTTSCACGWDARVHDRSPARAVEAAVAAHREHLLFETDRSPLRDYLLVGLVAIIVGLILLAMGSIVIGAAGGASPLG